MTKMQDAVAAAARTLIGVRFRPQGRDPAFGLDCVGVAAIALARAGRPVQAPRSYAQRGGDSAEAAALIDAAGLARIDPALAGSGDVLLLETGPAQRHLGILTGDGMVHADAGLRRVVETPGSPRWPVIAAWRVAEAG